MQPFVSVVIPTFNAPGHVTACVEAVRRQDYPADRFEVIVVDNGPAQNEGQFLVQAASCDGAAPRYVWEPQPGSHLARHAGIRAAAGDIIVFTDDDTEVSPGWLTALVACFDDPKVGAAGGPVTTRWSSTPPAWVPPLNMYGDLDYGSEFKLLDSPRTLAGANFSARKSALFETGGFNADMVGPNMVCDGETGLCHKLYRAGWKLAYTPDAPVDHVQEGAGVTLESMKGRFGNFGRFRACHDYKAKPVGRVGLMVRAARATARAAVSKGKALLRRPARGQSYYAQEMLVSQNLATARHCLKFAWDADFRCMATREDWLTATADPEPGVS